MKIELTTSPSAEDAKFISQGLVSFNQNKVPELASEGPETKFSIFARDETDTIIGGLRAICFWNTLHVELLWVSEHYRGEGIGSKLMHKAETFASQKGIGLSLLESTDWQAKSFYEKLDYRLLATLPDYPKGHATHFLVKNLSFTHQQK